MKVKTTISCAAILLLSACGTLGGHKKEINDCSAMFETRDAHGQKISKKENKLKTEEEVKAEAEKPATVCKVLEVKIDDKTKCEIVGSDKIDSLATVLNENKRNKIILITPEDKLNNLKKLAENYLKTSGVDINKYISSDVFKNLDFPYKGIRCKASGKEIVAWSGNKRLVITIGN